MDEEFEQDEISSDDSTVYQDGSQDADSSLDATSDTDSEPVASDSAPESATPVDPGAQTSDTKPNLPEPTFARPDDGFFSKEEREKLSGWLSDEAIDVLASAGQRNVAERVSTALVAHEQQQDFARSMNIPPEYAGHVRAAMTEVPATITDPQARVEAAMFISMHKLARQGVDIYDQMQAFVDAKRGERTPPPAPAPPKKSPPPAPLPPNAVTTRGSVTGATVPVRANGARSTDPLDKLFPFAAGS